jgi:outer membrane protein OmpA-like peptidoglycan-associated protein
MRTSIRLRPDITCFARERSGKATADSANLCMDAHRSLGEGGPKRGHGFSQWGFTLGKLVLVFLLGLPAWVEGKAGYTSANFLKIGMSARAAAMGDSFTGLADDSSAIYWNPAGLYQVRGTNLSLTHSQWLESVNIEYISLSQHLGDDGAIGMGFTLLGLQSANSTVEDSGGYYGGTGPGLNANDWGFSLGYSNSLGRILPAFQDTLAGVKVSMVSQNESGSTGSAFSCDLGLLQLFPKDHFSVGFDVLNIGSPIQDREQPLLIKTGAAWYHLNNFDKNDRLTLAVDVDLHNDTGLQPRVGGEYKLPLDQANVVAIRAGLRTTDDQYGFSFMTLGAGLARAFSGFVAGLDYAFVPYGTIGPTHRVSLNINWLGGEKALKAELAGPARFNLDKPSVPLDLKSRSDAPVADWTLTLTNEKGVATRQFTGKGKPPESLNWDGKNEKGELVEPGTYVAMLSVKDIEDRKADTAPVSFRAFAPLSLKDFHWTLSSDAIFDVAKAELKEKGKRELVKVEAGLQKYFIDAIVEIRGHTDSKPCRIGPNCKFKDNQELSMARAQTVKDLFVQLGLKQENVVIVGFGETVPVAENKTVEGRGKNRRIEVLIQSIRDEKTVDGVTNAGLFLVETGKLDQALELFKRVVEYEPKNARVQFLIGDCLFKMGKLEEAKEASDKALSLTKTQ